MVFGVIALVCAVMSVFMSETARLPLPDRLVSTKSSAQVAERQGTEEELAINPLSHDQDVEEAKVGDIQVTELDTLNKEPDLDGSKLDPL